MTRLLIIPDGSIEQRFHAITSHCHITVLGLLPGVVQAICTALPVDSIIDELQRQRRAPQQSSRPANPDCLSDCPGSPIRVSVADGLSSPLFTGSDRASADCQGEVPTRSKVELWQELKINGEAFVRFDSVPSSLH